MKPLRWIACLALVLAAGSASAATFSTIYTFDGNKEPNTPEAGLLLGGDGALYGTTAYGGKRKLFGTIYRLIPPVTRDGEWMEETLYTFFFTRNPSARPVAKLIFDQDTGALLGTASGQEQGIRKGALFRLEPPATPGGAWTYQDIHDFTGIVGDQNDGEGPYSGLVQDPVTGTIFGATSGGVSLDSNPGTVYGFTPDATHHVWTHTLNHAFSGADGARPLSDLALRDGTLYGTTLYGGNVTDECPNGCGTIFSMDVASGALRTLYASPGGGQPSRFGSGTMLLDDQGSQLYGTSRNGVPEHCRTERVVSCGTAYSMPADGHDAPAVLAAFGGKRSAMPDAGMIWDATHTVLYGTTHDGLPNSCKFHEGKSGCGTVFKLVRGRNKWEYSLIHAFDGSDGAHPCELILGPDGTLYGTTTDGGARRFGTVFKIENP